VNEEVVPAFFISSGAHRDAATSLLMRGRGGWRLLAEKRDHLKDRLIPCHFDT